MVYWIKSELFILLMDSVVFWQAFSVYIITHGLLVCDSAAKSNWKNTGKARKKCDWSFFFIFFKKIVSSVFESENVLTVLWAVCHRSFKRSFRATKVRIVSMFPNWNQLPPVRHEKCLKPLPYSRTITRAKAVVFFERILYLVETFYFKSVDLSNMSTAQVHL